VIYACPRAVLSAGLAGETQHQLLRPIPRSPGIIPAVLTPDFSYRRAATVLSRNTITVHHPGEGTPQFLAILGRKLAGPAQARRGGSARARAEAGSGRRQAAGDGPFFSAGGCFLRANPARFWATNAAERGRGARDGAKVRCEIRDAPAGAGASDVGGVGGALPAVVRQRWRRAAGAAGAVRAVTLRVAAGRSGAAGAPSPRAAGPRSRGSNTRGFRGQSSFRSRPKGSRRTLP
jgi:hypothetical protein